MLRRAIFTWSHVEVCEVQRVAMAHQEVRLRRKATVHSPILASKALVDFEPLRVILQGWGGEGMPGETLLIKQIN